MIRISLKIIKDLDNFNYLKKKKSIFLKLKIFMKFYLI